MLHDFVRGQSPSLTRACKTCAHVTEKDTEQSVWGSICGRNLFQPLRLGTSPPTVFLRATLALADASGRIVDLMNENGPPTKVETCLVH